MIAEDRFKDEEKAALLRGLDALMESDLVIADLHPGNFVYANNENEGHYFVLIDGIGSTNAIPLKVWCRKLNRISKRSKVEKLHRRIAKEILKRDQASDGGGK